MSDDTNIVRPKQFNDRPTAEQEIAQRGAEIFAEFQQRKDDMMVERIAQRVVELLRAEPISLPQHGCRSPRWLMFIQRKMPRQSTPPSSK